MPRCFDMTIRNGIVLSACWLYAGILPAQTRLEILPAPANVFPGATATATVAISSSGPLHDRLAWEFSVADAVMARGERPVAGQTAVDMQVAIVLEFPALRPDVVVPVYLRAHLMDAPAQAAAKRFWIMGDEPWLGRRAWIKQADILLFDPAGTTADLLEQAGLDFKLTRNPDALLASRPGMLLIGEGLSFMDYRGLPLMMSKAAASGIPVVCLAPTGGEMELPAADLSGGLQSLRLADAAMTAEFDKRLDRTLWSHASDAIVSTFRLECRANRVWAVFEAAPGGWTWLEVVFAESGAAMLVTGYGIAANWNTTPAARHLFLRLLERAVPPRAAESNHTVEEAEQS